MLKDLGMDKADYSALLPEDLGAILHNWDKKTASNLAREVIIRDKVLGETIQFVPGSKVVRIYARDITERKKTRTGSPGSPSYMWCSAG